MTKWIGRPILLCVVAAAGVLTTTGVASAAGATSDTVVVTESPGSPYVGEPVTYTATITGTSGGAAPSGTVTFTDTATGSPVACTAVAVTLESPSATSGVSTATCTGTYTKAGPDTVTATYSGDAIYEGNSGSLLQSIAKATTSVTLADSTSSPVTGQSVTFTATVLPETAGTPTGTVTFTAENSGPALPSSCAAVTLSASDTASCSVAAGIVGSSPPSVEATYNGDANFQASAPSSILTTNPVAIATTRVLVTANPTVAQPGQSVTYTATVLPTAPAGGTPTGTITFSNAASNLDCTNLTANAGSLVGNSLTCTVSGTSDPAITVAASPIAVTATYSGSTSYSGSSGSGSVTVVQGTTSTTLIVNPKRVLVGGPLTITAIVTTPPPAVNTISGEVSFVLIGKHSGPINCTTVNGVVAIDNSADLMSNNEATCTISSIAAAANPVSVTVNYYGDSDYTGSTASTKIKLH